MDNAPNDKDFFSEFVSSLGTEGDEELCNPVKVTGEVRSTINSEVNQSDNVWLDIEGALHQWTCKILDVESRIEKAASLRETIEASLRRQQLDGFLNTQDVAELRYVADVWTNLLNCTSSHALGCKFVKRDIITYLVELYT